MSPPGPFHPARPVRSCLASAVPAHRRVDPAQRVAPEARAELGTSSVRLLADLEQRRTDRKTTARWQCLDAQVEVHVELVARERPAVRVLLDGAQDPRADQRDLALRIATAVLACGCCRARTSCRRSRRTSCRARPIDELALVDGRPPGDQLESAAITRGGPHVGKERLEVAIARGVHRPPSVADPGNPRNPELRRRSRRRPHR